jgi:glycosyltransferase involved in cell wall biosynthesis
VLHVSEPTDGGAAAVAIAIAADQVQRGWRVTVAGPETGFLLDRSTDVGARAVVWRAVGNPGLVVPGETRALRRIIEQSNPDVVHLHSSKAGLAGRLAVRGRRPTIFQPHGWSFRVSHGLQAQLARAWERAGARWSVVLCVSEGEHRRGIVARVHADYAVIPNGVDTERFAYADRHDRTEARVRLSLSEVPTALAVGRQSSEKGHEVLLDAWSYVRDAVPDAVLLLVGDGPDRQRLEGRRVPGVCFVGEVADVVPWYAAADVVALPSWSEAMPLSVLEAMATGRAAVVTDVDGAREAIGDDRAGTVVPVGDPAALGDGLVARLIDRDRADTEGRVGRERAESRYSLPVWHDRMARLVEAVTGS